jgi:excisionase family DNA binding protein
MSARILHNFETVAPSEADALLAGESSRRLATQKLGRKTSIRIQVLDDGEEVEAVVVPASVLHFFQNLLTEMSQGNAVTLIPTHTELTTQQAADLLNVSRPYVVKLLDDGTLPGHTAGKYHRVRLDDLLAFKKKDDDSRAKILDELTAEAQALGMY